MSVDCVTELALPHLAGEPFLNKTEMSGEIVQARSPGIGRCPVPTPPLPDLAIEAVIGERPYSYAIGTRQGGMNVDHVDLGIGIARIDADINVDLATVVAIGHLKAVEHDA